MDGVKTWHVERAVVAAVLLAVWACTGRRGVELLGAAAVLATFASAQVSDRMAEAQGALPRPMVECYEKWLFWFVAKELCWLGYFLLLRSYSALVGVGVFLAYPLWRKWWRSVHPRKAWTRPA